MGDEIRSVAGEVFDLTFATGPRVAGATVTLEALYGIDGVDTGTDASSTTLVFPVALDEGSPGVYSTPVILHEQGPFWARFSTDGGTTDVTVVRALNTSAPGEDIEVGTPYTVAAIIPARPLTMELGLFDDEGANVGLDSSGVAISWPQPMTQVSGQTDSWYFATVAFTEGARVQVALDPPTGPSYNDVLTVSAAASAAVLVHFAGWEPTAGYVPAAWVALSYIRKWTGWTQAHVSDEDLRELRRTAIETFITETNSWWPAWEGTWYGLRDQGSRLYLPVPLLLPQDGGIDPVVAYYRPEGDQELVETLSNDDLVWRVRGRDTKQPYVEHITQFWDHTLDVRVTGTWGAVGIDKTLPLRIKQVIVGLMRWHSLSFGVDADDARDQSTLNRIASEGTRDARAVYHDTSIGRGLTGDRTVDRALAELTIQPGPWIRRGGSLPAEGGRHINRRA